jgi:hypothetical protein
MTETTILPPTIQPLPTSSAVTPMAMITQALERNASVEVLAQLMSLQERHEANMARKAFDAAVAAAKGEIPPIVKNRVVDYTSNKGRTNYRHEDLAGIAKVVDPILNKHGLSYRHRSAQEGQRLRVTCVLSHRDGYSEETTLEAAEDHTGNKNSIQAIGSAATYLQRYTLKLALGLSATVDDDGAASGAPEETITDEQADQIRTRLTETGADVEKFLRVLHVESIPDIRASQWDAVKVILAARKKAETTTNA